ncbi:MAG TPA: Flp pilus assembly protein CpaB [Acetobacteraceae bacterium]|nr:Flp pilus assembly protein CpaB [Acetobacteraceae bacterium]
MLVRNLLLALGVLTLLAGLALSAIWLTQRDRGAVTEAKVPPAVQPAILVAARPIHTGMLLRAEDIVWRDVGRNDVTVGSLMRGQVQESEFLGAVARRDFRQDEPLVASDFVKSGERGFLAAVLKPGRRAVSIPVDATQSSSGLLLPGARIDVILIQSFGDTADPSRKEVAETVLADVRAIAVDQSLSAATKAASADRRLGGIEPPLPKTVTLEVTPRQAEVLLVASQLGRLGVSVRALEGSGVPEAGTGVGAGSTWASDVSPALKQLGGRQQRPFTTGSSIEKSIRTVPPRGAPDVGPEGRAAARAEGDTR